VDQNWIISIVLFCFKPYLGTTAASCPLFDIGVKGISVIDNAIELPLKQN